MKKILFVLKWGCVVLLVLGLSSEWIIRTVTSREWFRNYVIEQTQKALRREVRAEQISASLFGLRLRGVSVAEEGGFEKGEFLTVPRAQVHFSLLHLVHAHIKIKQLILQGAQLKIVRLENGTFNFESLGSDTPSEEPSKETEEKSLFRLTLDSVSLDNLSFTYQNLQNGQLFSATGIALGVKRFAFDKEFPLTLNTTLYYKDKTQDILLPVGLNARVQLANLDMTKAYADISDFSLKYKKNLLRLKGRVENWQEPKFNATLSSKNLSSDVAAPWTTLPDFELKEASVHAEGEVKTSASTVSLSAGKIHIPGGDLSLKGQCNYAKGTYDAKGDYTIDFTEADKWFPKEYKKMGLKGLLSGTYDVNTQEAKTEFSVQDGAYFHPSAGHFSKVAATFTVQESMNFKTGNLSGKMDGVLNQNPFHTDLTVSQQPSVILAQLNGSANRLALPPAMPSKEAEPEFVEEVQLEPLPASKWPLPPIHLKSNIKIGSLDAPYLYATNLQFSSDLEGITPKLNQAHGVLSLKMGEGKILDLYKLTNANALTKVLFLSLNITGKVFNSLNVFSVLNGLKKGVVSAVTGNEKEETTERMVVQPMLDEEGNPIEVLVPYTEEKNSGQMAYDKLETDIYFDRGVASIKRGTFVSDTMSVRLDGTTDFNSGNIKMKVHAAPGKHDVDGMLPLTVNITGTVSDPKGSMSMIGSVTSLVKQTVANNAVSRQVKKGVRGVLGLFKKKDDTQEETPENTGEVVPEETPAADTPQEESPAPAEEL